MQSLLNCTIIFIAASFFAFVTFDFTVNIIALWKRCNPQQTASQQMQAEPQPQIKPQPQQEKLSNIWEESEVSPLKRPMQPAPMIFQLALPPAKEVVAVAVAPKKRGRPSKKSVATTLPTAEAELAATFCQPEQIAAAPKKRGRPSKKSAA